MMRSMLRLRPIPTASVAIKNLILPSRLLKVVACAFFVYGGSAPYIRLQWFSVSFLLSAFGLDSWPEFMRSSATCYFSVSFTCSAFYSFAFAAAFSIYAIAELIWFLIWKHLARVKATMQSPCLRSANVLICDSSTDKVLMRLYSLTSRVSPHCFTSSLTSS